MGWSRRRFLGATAATACVGCSDTTSSGRQGVEVVGADSRPRGEPVEPDVTTWPGLDPVVRVGPLDDVLARIDAGGTLYVPEAHAWMSRYPAGAVGAGLEVYDAALSEGIEAGVIALFQKCPHLGCRVPFCESSGWFECPCHGSRYTVLGEHREGPGPRGMDSFAVRVDGGEVAIDRTHVVEGLPGGTTIVDQPPVGPHCVDLGDH